jgi:hypothetical protein
MAAKQRLGDLLLEAKLIEKNDLEKALRLQVGGNRRLGYLLIKMGFLSEEKLHGVLAQQLDLPLADIERDFSANAKKILPRYLCRKYSILPLNLGENNTLKAAMVDPSDSEAVADIEKYTGKVIRPVLASKSIIDSNIRARIPWSLKDFFNAQTSTRVTAGIASIALLLAIGIATQFYQERKLEKFGRHTVTPQATTYENLELILGFDEKSNISLLGRGAHSPGYYSVTFHDDQSLQTFLEAKKDGFSGKQLEWLKWAMTNPHGKTPQ